MNTEAVFFSLAVEMIGRIRRAAATKWEQSATLEGMQSALFSAVLAFVRFDRIK